MPRPERKRLSVDIPTEIFEQTKLMAQRRNLTLTRYILKLIFNAMKKEKELGG